MKKASNTHRCILRLFAFTGAHRFGKPISATVYFFTVGLFIIGWLVDLFLIPSLACNAILNNLTIRLQEVNRS